MVIAEDRKFFAVIALLVLVLITFPYLAANQFWGSQYVFGGFLLNPLDGNTYLAKMYQGWEGDWRFKLPYTSEPGDGAYIHLYYLFLGHLSRWLRLPQLFIFHGARVLGTFLMLLVMMRFFRFLFAEKRKRRLAFALATLGSGMGWLAILFGVFTSDFWVAEAYPFLSAYANAHFPLGLALILFLVTPSFDFSRPTNRMPGEDRGTIDPGKISKFSRPSLFVIAAFILGVVSPFGVVVSTVALGGVVVWEGLLLNKSFGLGVGFLRNLIGRGPGSRLIWVIAGGGPVLIYDFVAIRTDPILSMWDAQNITPSPSMSDFILSFSPTILFAILGAWRVVRSESQRNEYKSSERMTSKRILVAWMLLSLILITIPLGLQRRFLMGLYIPAAGLAVIGIDWLGKTRSRFRLWSTMVLVLALPTNLVVLTSAFQGIRTHNELLYLTNEEVEAFKWLTRNTSSEALVLAAPETGLFIPAYTGRRVIYGHPFETVEAEIEEERVSRFFLEYSESEALQFIRQREIDYLFYGPREVDLGALPLVQEPKVVFQKEGVKVFDVTHIDQTTLRQPGE